MAKIGRPRKSSDEKVEYQLLAVHKKDYKVFIDKAEKAGLKNVEAFHTMVNKINLGEKIVVNVNNDLTS